MSQRLSNLNRIAQISELRSNEETKVAALGYGSHYKDESGEKKLFYLSEADFERMIVDDKDLVLEIIGTDPVANTSVLTGRFGRKKNRKSKVVDYTVDGDNVSYQAQTTRGVFPKTINSSDDPNDPVLFTTKEDMRGYLNTQLIKNSSIREAAGLGTGATVQERNLTQAAGDIDSVLKRKTGFQDEEDTSAGGTVLSIEEKFERGELTLDEAKQELILVQDLIQESLEEYEAFGAPESPEPVTVESPSEFMKSIEERKAEVGTYPFQMNIADIKGANKNNEAFTGDTITVTGKDKDGRIRWTNDTTGQGWREGAKGNYPTLAEGIENQQSQVATERQAIGDEAPPGARQLAKEDATQPRAGEKMTNIKDFLASGDPLVSEMVSAVGTPALERRIFADGKNFELLVELGYLSPEDYDAFKDARAKSPGMKGGSVARPLTKARRKFMKDVEKEAKNIVNTNPELSKTIGADAKYRMTATSRDRLEAAGGPSDIANTLGISNETQAKYNIAPPDFTGDTPFVDAATYIRDNETALRAIGTDPKVIDKVREIIQATPGLNKPNPDINSLVNIRPVLENFDTVKAIEIAAALAGSQDPTKFNENFEFYFNLMASGQSDMGLGDMQQEQNRRQEFFAEYDRKVNEYLDTVRREGNEAAITAATELTTGLEEFYNDIYTVSRKKGNDIPLGFPGDPFKTGAVDKFKKVLNTFYVKGGLNGQAVEFDSTGKLVLDSVNPQAYNIIKDTVGAAFMGYAAENGPRKFGDWFRDNPTNTLSYFTDNARFTTFVDGAGNTRLKEVIIKGPTGRNTDVRLSGTQLTSLVGAPGSRERAILMDFIAEDTSGNRG